MHKISKIAKKYLHFVILQHIDFQCFNIYRIWIFDIFLVYYDTYNCDYSYINCVVQTFRMMYFYKKLFS